MPWHLATIAIDQALACGLGVGPRRAPGQRHVVTAVEAPAHCPEWAEWLEELGFIPGEQVMLMTRAALGGDPLVVRVGQSTFALRAAEAACVHVSAVS